MNTQLSIIYVNYHSAIEVERSLRSIVKFTNTAFEVIVINNSAKDDSLEHIKTIHSNIRIIDSPENYGFGKACNLGITLAKGEFVLLLNPDTHAEENVIDASLLAYKKLDPETTGPLTCRHAYEDGRFQYSCYCREDLPIFPFIKLPWRRASTAPKEYFESSSEVQKNHASSSYTYGIHGSFFLCRRELLLDHPFDNDFFLYSEEVDLCRRLEAIGKRSYFLAEATIVHSSKRASESTAIRNQMYLSSGLLVLKMYGRLGFLLYHSLRVFRAIGICILIPFLSGKVKSTLRNYMKDARPFSADYLKIIGYGKTINSGIPLKSASLPTTKISL